MERLLIKGKSKEDMRLIADLALKIGMTIEYIPDEEHISTLHEPESLAEWNRLSPNQQQGLLDAIDDFEANGGKKNSDVMKAVRKKYE